MIAETVSLGILSLPSVLAEIGIVPSVTLQTQVSKPDGYVQRCNTYFRSWCCRYLHRLRNRAIQATISARTQHGRRWIDISGPYRSRDFWRRANALFGFCNGQSHFNFQHHVQHFDQPWNMHNCFRLCGDAPFAPLYLAPDFA